MDQNILVLRQTNQFENLESNFWKVLHALMTHCFYEMKNKNYCYCATK